MRLLVVENDAITGESLAELMRVRGHQADWAANAEAALARLRVHPYDALIVDEYMPGLDGLGLLRRLREGAIHAALPAVLITAAADDAAAEIARELKELKPAALLRKPFEIGAVVALLDGMTLRPA